MFRNRCLLFSDNSKSDLNNLKKEGLWFELFPFSSPSWHDDVDC